MTKPIEHGVNGYRRGCGCDTCREGTREYMSAYRTRRRQPDYTPRPKRTPEERLATHREADRNRRSKNPEKYREADRRYYQRHREERLARDRERRAKDPEKYREYDRRYRERLGDEYRERQRKQAHERRAKNPELARERDRRYREQNPERLREIKRCYEQKHPDTERARVEEWKGTNKRGWLRIQARYEASEKGQRKLRLRRYLLEPWNGFATPEQRELLFRQYGGRCWICGEPGADVMHHVIPVALGGTNWPDNLRPAHARCASSKSSRDVWAARKSGRLPDLPSASFGPME